MKIKKIVLKNFRQYKDIEFSFSEEKSQDLNYILAENGIGKTTLLNAITWCLYGRELHTTEKLKQKALPILTLDTFRNMEISGEEDSVVSITLSELDGEITFYRYITFRKTEDNLPYEKTKGQKVIITRNNQPGVVQTSEAEFQTEVNKRLPQKIQQFFFFDGEQLDTYLVGTTGQNVEQTVLQISQIDLLVTMEEHLNTLSSEMRRKITKTNPHSAEINKKYEEKEKEVTSLSSDYLDKKEKLEKAKNELREINEELGDEPDIAELEEERNSLNREHDDYSSRKEENLNDIKSTMREYTMILTALPKLREMYDKIKEKESRNELPPKYDKEELLSMLHSHHCFVCDRDLDGKSTVYLENLLHRFEINSETGMLLTRITGSLQTLIEKAKDYPHVRDRLYETKDLLDQKLDSIELRINEIDSIINKYTDKEKIIKLYRKREDLETFIEDLDELVLRLKIEKEKCEDECIDLKNELDAALQSEKEHSKLYKEQKLADRAKNRVSLIISNIKGDIKNQISSEMSNKFFELMWKEKFKKVELTDNYTASVINNDGLECLGSCSAAERELLVLAFTLALHKQSGFDGPLVIDTPISRISGKLRVSFAKVLRKVSEYKQIILFMTDDEYSTNVKDIFETSANCKFKLELVSEDFIKVEKL